MQLLESWQAIKNRPPDTPLEILNEYIFDNKYICSNGLPLNYKSLKIPLEIAKTMRVKDLTTDNREIKTYNEIKRIIDWNLSLFSYNIIVCAIPKLWKQKVKGFMENIITVSNVTIQIKRNSVNIAKITNKAIYWELLSSKIKAPNAINTWIDLFPFMEIVPWDRIFKSIHSTLLPPYMQTFQYKVINTEEKTRIS